MHGQWRKPSGIGRLPWPTNLLPLQVVQDPPGDKSHEEGEVGHKEQAPATIPGPSGDTTVEPSGERSGEPTSAEAVDTSQNCGEACGETSHDAFDDDSRDGEDPQLVIDERLTQNEGQAILPDDMDSDAASRDDIATDSSVAGGVMSDSD